MKILPKLRLFSYHQKQNKEALIALKQIEKYKGKTSSKLLKTAENYAVDVLGSKKYAPWLYVYTALHGEFREGWIPDNYYGSIIVPKLKGSYGRVAQNNGLQYIIFKDNSFPDILYYVNNLFISKNLEVLSSTQAMNLIQNNGEKLVYKKDSSAQGKGVIIAKDISLEKIKTYGNGVLQYYINQASFFDEITPGSVATLRLTTIINSAGESRVIAAYLRLGRKEETHVLSESAIKVPVDIFNGNFYNSGYTANWRVLNKHPDSGFVFANQVIPYFSKCVEKVVELHKKIPFVRIIGWDVTIDNKYEVKIMEWNGGHNDIKFSEATQGPIFKNIDLNKF